MRMNGRVGAEEERLHNGTAIGTMGWSCCPCVTSPGAIWAEEHLKHDFLIQKLIKNNK